MADQPKSEEPALGVDPSASVRVLACMSCPRLGFTDPLFLFMPLTKMGIEIRKHSGAFWEQSLSRMLYAAVDEDFDYVLTVDYDSVFRPSDIMYMLNLMVQHPSAAAIFPLQYRRESDELLLGIDGVTDGSLQTSKLAAHLVPATVGHFGLTLIRVSTLRRMPHPWLHSTPGPDGRWSEQRIDADISFWNKLRAMGEQAYCAPRAVIGHLQQVITWPGENLLPHHQYVGKYFGDGDMPAEVNKEVKRRVEESERG